MAERDDVFGAAIHSGPQPGTRALHEARPVSLDIEPDMRGHLGGNLELEVLAVFDLMACERDPQRAWSAAAGPEQVPVETHGDEVLEARGDEQPELGGDGPLHLQGLPDATRVTPSDSLDLPGGIGEEAPAGGEVIELAQPLGALRSSRLYGAADPAVGMLDLGHLALGQLGAVLGVLTDGEGNRSEIGRRAAVSLKPEEQAVAIV